MVSKKRKIARINYPGGGTREAWSNLDNFRPKEKTENPTDFLYRLETKPLGDY